MKTHFKEILLDSHENRELINISSAVSAAVSESGVREGLCLIYSTHTTGSIVINEDEEGLVRDIVAKVAEDFPRRGTWLHNLIDSNAHSHLAGTYLGPSVTVPVRGGSAVLGQYQSVFFLELDGPRSGRKVVIEVLGD